VQWRTYLCCSLEPENEHESMQHQFIPLPVPVVIAVPRVTITPGIFTVTFTLRCILPSCSDSLAESDMYCFSKPRRSSGRHSESPKTDPPQGLAANQVMTLKSVSNPSTTHAAHSRNRDAEYLHVQPGVPGVLAIDSRL